MLRLCNVSGMTCYIFFAVLHIVWLDGIQKDHLWTWVNSQWLLVSIEHVRLEARGLSSVPFLLCLAVTGQPSASYHPSTRVIACLWGVVWALITLVHVQMKNVRTENMWSARAEDVSVIRCIHCIWFQVAKLRLKSTVKKGIVSFIQRIVAVVALWSSVINDLPTASVFVCQAVPRGPWKCWILYFSAG